MRWGTLPMSRTEAPILKFLPRFVNADRGREKGGWDGKMGALRGEIGTFGRKLTLVTAVTDRLRHLGDTPVVNMVRRASKKVLFEPGDTRQQWKGEAAASF